MATILEVWVIYDHPRDFPDWYIVRRQISNADGTIQIDKRACGFHELANARAWLAQKGLTCLARNPDDDPVIVETWL